MTMQQLHNQLRERPYLIEHLTRETLQNYLKWLFDNEIFSALLDVVEIHARLEKIK